MSEEDIKIGMSLCMIGSHCSGETTKLSQFLLQLEKKESLSTFILAIVNTLQSQTLTPYQKLKLGRFYHIFDADIFGFHLGKVLLTTSLNNGQTTVFSVKIYSTWKHREKEYKYVSLIFLA